MGRSYRLRPAPIPPAAASGMSQSAAMSEPTAGPGPLAPTPAAPPAGRLGRGPRRLAAVAEVTAVVFLGNVLLVYTERFLGLASWRGLQAHMTAAGRVDWLVLARVALVELLVKYGWMLALAFAIGWWHRRRRPAAYGLTRGGRSLVWLLVAGVVLAGPAGFLPYGFELLGRIAAPGGAVQATLPPDHPGAGFYVYMAVAGFVLAPILEEILARGYMQRRLTEDFGPGAGILLVSAFFALAHGDFLQPSLAGAGDTLAVFAGALVMGYAFYRTGSLVPSIVAHGLLNFPFPDRRLPALAVLVALMALVPLAFFRPVARWARGLGRLLADVDSPQGTAAGVLFFTLALLTIFSYHQATGAVAVGLLALALVLDARDRPPASRPAAPAPGGTAGGGAGGPESPAV